MKKPKALYEDDLIELIERMEDNLGELSIKIKSTLIKYAKSIMIENQNPWDDK